MAFCVVVDVDVDSDLDVFADFDIDVNYADGKVSVVDCLNEKSPMMGPLHVQKGWFFNWSTQISVLKRKTLFNQQGSFVH